MPLTSVNLYFRRSGLAHTNDERFPGASGIAAPAFAGDGSVAAALPIAGATERLKIRAHRIEPILRASAAQCSCLLSGALRNEDCENNPASRWLGIDV